MLENKKQYSIFKKPISKDNFWNLIFWLGMSTGVSVSLIISEVLHIAFLSTAIIWLTIIFIPFIVVKNNPVKYDAEAKIFLNSEGQSLEKKHPKTLLWVVVCTILAPVMTGGFLDQHKNEIPDIVATLMIIFTLFGAPALYFSILECPITWLFNKKAWAANPNNARYVAPHSIQHASALSKSSALNNSRDAINRRYSDVINNPAYSSLSCNIYHRR